MVRIKNKENNKTIELVTTHLSYIHEFGEAKNKQLEINRLIEYIAQSKNTLIVAGDLNTPHNSKYIKQIEEYLINCGPNYEEKIWTTKPFSYKGFVEENLNWRLDYVFVSKVVKVKEAKVIDTQYSDHLPILVEIEV